MCRNTEKRAWIFRGRLIRAHLPPPLRANPRFRPTPCHAKYSVRTMENISFENLSYTRAWTKGNWIPVRGGETRMWTEGPRFQATGTRAPLHPLRPPCRRFTAFFFVSSSFLIAANRDVKTIRDPLGRLGSDAQFFLRLQPLVLSLFRSTPCV